MINAIPHKKPITEPNKQLISRRELAERWSCCIQAIKSREDAGILKPIRFGSRLWRYRLSDVLALETLQGGIRQ
jgi:hypothetical protein